MSLWFGLDKAEMKNYHPNLGFIFGTPQKSDLGPNNYFIYTKSVMK